jgi:hypothetical protein
MVDVVARLKILKWVEIVEVWETEATSACAEIVSGQISRENNFGRKRMADCDDRNRSKLHSHGQADPDWARIQDPSFEKRVRSTARVSQRNGARTMKKCSNISLGMCIQINMPGVV